MAETHLIFRDVSEYSELFIDELGSCYCMSCFDGIVCCEVVVFTGVEDDTAVADDNSGHELVNQRSLHVDISEEDAVDSVVKHNVKSFESTHCSDFRHAHSG